MKVLIVDDSPFIVVKIVELLDDYNSAATCESCGSYPEALELLHTHTPEVALLDINLPGKSGIDLLGYIKTNFPETMTIIITNQSSDYYKKLCFRSGADYFLDKSKDMDSLPDILSLHAN